MERRIAIAFLILALAVALSATPVHAENDYIFTINPAYVTVSITIRFAFTSTFTTPTVSTASNQSVWRLTDVSNTGFTFITEAVDVFKFGFTVYYPVSIIQTVLVQVFQGNPKVEGRMEIPIIGVAFSMSFTVVTSQQPSYPTPQDIFNMWAGQYPTRQDFLSWTQWQTNSLETQRINQMWQWVAVFGGLALLTATNLLPKLKKSREEP